MGRKTLCVCLALGLVAQPSLHAQAPADAEVAKGIKQVEDGDLDIGIFTLDASARRLAADPARTRELAQAYLYLGIAYLGKGQETLAKTKFREAVQQIRELSLNPDQFPPKVIDIFEAAKAEVAGTATRPKPAPSPAPTSAPSATPSKKGGSKTPLIILGVAAAAGGVALAAGGGGAGAGTGGVVDLARFYGTYTNAIFTTQVSGCSGFSATLVLSGNPDGSNFRLDKSYGPVTFTGTIQRSGDFTGTGGGYSIRGQTTGSRIAGSESQQSGSPLCTWTFDGSR